MGRYTCQKFPGIWDHIKTDVETYVEWGVDLVKMDACYNLGKKLMGEGICAVALNAVSLLQPVFQLSWFQKYLLFILNITGV